MALASISRFNCKGIELGGMRSAWLWFALNLIRHVHTHACIMPAGPLSASCTDKGICWGDRTCLIRGLPFPTQIPYVSLTQSHVAPDLMTPAGQVTFSVFLQNKVKVGPPTPALKYCLFFKHLQENIRGGYRDFYN